ncbi:MAG TPA: hypothetical protein PKD54_02170 [Pirellulaceae bacterium]|nr:hypothetical protein [Pirellulaceae bacterium]
MVVLVVSALLDCAIVQLLAAQRLEKVAETCPTNTMALICIDDLRELRRQIMLTDSISAIAQMPKSVDWLEGIEREVQAVVADPEKNDGQNRMQNDWWEFLNGPAELVLLKDRKLSWYVRATFDRHHWFAHRLLTLDRHASESTGDKEKQIIKLNNSALHILGESKVVLCAIGDSLIFASDEATLHAVCDRLDALPGRADETLAGQRRFQSTSAQLSKMSPGRPQISFYVDLNNITRELVRRSVNPVENQRLANQSGLDDLLTLAGAVILPKAPHSSVDWECLAVLNQGLPRTGINQAIALQKLSEPLSDFVPFHVDFAFRLQFDPHEFCGNITAVDQLLSELTGQSGTLIRAIGNVAPYLAAICDLNSDDRAAVIGKFEQCGWLVESANHTKWPIINRLATVEGQADQVLNAMLHAEHDLINVPMRHGLRYQLSPESLARIEARLEELRQLNPGLAFTEIPQQVFWSRDNAIWLASDLDGKSINPEHWMTRAERPLNREPVFQKCWDHVTATETPVLYFYLANGMMLRPLARWSAVTTSKEFHQLQLERIAQLDTTSAAEHKHHLRMLKAIEHWRWSEWRQQLGPGALALYETSSGIAIRIVQFRCSE